MTRGLFLSLDGLDGTGKSTQCRLLADWLRERGRTVVTSVDPGGTPVGDRLRQLIFHPEQALNVTCEALLFMASRAQLVNDVIRPALTAGSDVVTDRFLLANVVYQGHAGGLDPDELWQVFDRRAGARPHAGARLAPGCGTCATRAAGRSH
jgi:dTMP kinase